MSEGSAKKRASGPRAKEGSTALAPKDEATAAKAEEKTKAAPPDDVALVHGRTPDGEGLHVLRKRGDTLSLGEVRPLKEGKPIQGEVVKLKPREDMPLLCDVEVQHAPAARGAGPARVASSSYRSGWDGIWGKGRKRTKPTLN